MNDFHTAQQQINLHRLNSFDMESSNHRRFNYQMAALGFAFVGASLILSPAIALVAGAPMTVGAIVGLVSGGVISLVFGGGFTAAKNSELSKQVQYSTVLAAQAQSPAYGHGMQPQQQYPQHAQVYQMQPEQPHMQHMSHMQQYPQHLHQPQWQEKYSAKNTDVDFKDKLAMQRQEAQMAGQNNPSK